MKAFCIVLFCILYITVDAWVGIIQNDPSTNHPGHCYSSHKNIGPMKRGEERRIEGECVVATCGNNKDIRLTGCGTAAVGPPCKIVAGNLSKPYPDCCFEIECPEGFKLY